MATKGVGAGKDGFVSTVNASKEGQIFVSGFHTTGKGPGSALHLLQIYWTAKSKVGWSILDLEVKDLATVNGSYYKRTNGIDGIINITKGPTPNPCVTPPPPAKVPGQMFLDPYQTKIYKGDLPKNFKVALKVNSGKNNKIGAFAAKIYFDTSILKMNKAAAPDTFGVSIEEKGMHIFADMKKDHIMVSGFDLSGKAPRPDVYLCTLNMTALKSNKCKFTPIKVVVVSLVDFYANEVPNAQGSSAIVSFEERCYKILGDVNEDGRVDITDAMLVGQYYVGLKPKAFKACKEAGDVNMDKAVDITDAMLIAQIYVGVIEKFPTK